MQAHCKINVAVGDVVKYGDALLVLEAMKMENVIKASGEAIVSQVKVSKAIVWRRDNCSLNLNNMNRLFSSEPLWGNHGLGIVRIVVGLLMVYHGHEVFRTELMKSYTEWEIFKGSVGTFKVYAGKTAELLAGISLTHWVCSLE